MPKPVGVAQVQRFADGVVGHARSESQTQQVCRKTAQRNSIRQEEGEVVQAEPATPRHRGDTGLLDKVHERRCASYAERSPNGATVEHIHAEHALVVLDRALEIADLQVNRADVSLLRQTRWRSDSIESRSVIHSRTHHFTPVLECMSGPCRLEVERHFDVVADQKPAGLECRVPCSPKSMQLSPIPGRVQRRRGCGS